MGPVYIPGDPRRFENYHRALERAGAAGTNKEVGAGALLLPGGGDVEPWRYGQANTASWDLEPERDEEELALIDRFVAVGKPILGVCRGMQVINVYFGGTLIQDIPGHSQIGGIDRLHVVRTADSSFPFRGKARLNSAHHQAVDRPGVGLLPLQWAEDGIIEGMVHRCLPVWAVQWHPERLGERGDRFLRAFLALCAEIRPRKNLF